MGEYIFFLISILILSVYVWKVLPFPFYGIAQNESSKNFVSIRLTPTDSKLKKVGLTILGFLSSLQYDRPAIEMQESHLVRFTHLFKEPVRPLIDRETLGDYYIGIPDFFKSLNQKNKTLIIFRSRLALITFPVRFLIDHLISKPLTLFFLIIYFFGICFFWGTMKLRSILQKPGVVIDEAVHDEKKAYFYECVDYLNEKLPPWEFGFLIFKALEGYQFRKAITEFGFAHPNCEFGIENTVISTTHLQGVDFVDVGTEAIETNVLLGDIKYNQVINCYIEGNPFQNAAFKDIYMIHVVDHIPDLSKAIEELSRITSPGGHVFFSGLSDLLSGYYLEQLIYQGNIYNNKNIEWYEDLVTQYGFKVKYKSYMHSGISYYLWRFTVFFHHRTEVWNVFSKFYHSYACVKRLYKWIVDSLLLEVFMADEYFVNKNKHGLNFMIVMQKSS